MNTFCILLMLACAALSGVVMGMVFAATGGDE